MVKLLVTQKKTGRKVLFLGLSEGNLRNFRERKGEILVDLRAMGYRARR